MITFIILYAIIGFLACFSTIVLSKVYKWTDDAAITMLPLLMMLLWPIGVPFAVLMIIILSLDDWAETVANRIKRR